MKLTLQIAKTWPISWLQEVLRRFQSSLDSRGYSGLRRPCPVLYAAHVYDASVKLCYFGRGPTGFT
jgi:hypothetical protein